MAGLACDAQTASGCNITALKEIRQACPETCGLCVAQMGGDPIFHYGGKWFKVSLPPRQPVPILTWTGGGGRRFRLFGAAFDAPDGQTGQWFGHFTLVANGINLFDAGVCHPTHNSCATSGLKTMRVELGGEVMTEAKERQRSDGVEVVETDMSHRPIGQARAERLTVKAGGTELEIYSAAGRKFSNELEQVRFAHLNMKLVKIPHGAEGLLAELMGQQPLSEESLTYVVPSKGGRPAGSEAVQARWDKHSQSLVAEYVHTRARAVSLAARDSRAATACPGKVPTLGLTRTGCRLCVTLHGSNRTYWQHPPESCADGCCENDVPCNGARANGDACADTAFNDPLECYGIIMPEDLPSLNKTKGGCKACLELYGASKTFYIEGDESCPHGCCDNSLPCDGRRSDGSIISRCDGTAYTSVEECDELEYPEPVPCIETPLAVCGAVVDNTQPAAAYETCVLDERCTDYETDPFGGHGCNAGGHGICRYCGFTTPVEDDKYPECTDSKATALEARARKAGKTLKAQHGARRSTKDTTQLSAEHTSLALRE